MHPRLELHIIDDGSVRNCVTNATDEYLAEDEVLVGVKQMDAWAEDSNRCLKGRAARTLEGEQLGIVDKFIYGLHKDLSKVTYMILTKDYIQMFKEVSTMTAQSTKVKNQHDIIAKEATESQLEKLKSQGQERQKKKRWEYQEIREEKEQPIVTYPRVRKPTKIIIENVQQQ